MRFFIHKKNATIKYQLLYCEPVLAEESVGIQITLHVKFQFIFDPSQPSLYFAQIADPILNCFVFRREIIRRCNCMNCDFSMHCWILWRSDRRFLSTWKNQTVIVSFDALFDSLADSVFGIWPKIYLLVSHHKQLMNSWSADSLV